MDGVASTIIELEDGRELCFAVHGPDDGVPVFAFHGTPGSRRQVAPVGELPAGTRIIAIDRPGYGHSSFHAGRRLTDFPGDVGAIADFLGIDRFGVMGVSGGGPHALVCAHAFGRRLLGACCVSGVARLDDTDAMDGMLRSNRMLNWVAQNAAFLLRPMMATQEKLGSLMGEKGFDAFLERLPEADREVLSDPVLRERLMVDVLRPGPTAARAAAQDFELFARPWGFDLADIDGRVHFWQGDQDLNVPPKHAVVLADAVPDSVLHECPGEGHLLAFSHMEEILDHATGRSSRA